MKFLIMLFILSWFMGPVAYSNCSARSSVFDFENRFQNEQDAFDFCEIRVKWWRLDSHDDWKNKFCTVSKYDRNGYTYWRSAFRHDFDRRFVGNNSYMIWENISRFYGSRIFRGYNSRIDFSFDSLCSYDSLEELPEIID